MKVVPRPVICISILCSIKTRSEMWMKWKVKVVPKPVICIHFKINQDTELYQVGHASYKRRNTAVASRGPFNGRISEENLNQRQSSFLVFLRTRAANQSSTSRKTYRTSSTSMSICRTIFWENTWRKMEELGNITKLRQRTSGRNCRRKNKCLLCNFLEV